jgi:site-specific DNA-methyltransferase (adenine-specific)
MAKKASVAADGSPPVEPKNRKSPALSRTPLRASSLLDTRVIYCGDNLEQLAKLPDACVDLIYIDPPFNSNRNYEVFWGETKEKRAFEDRHENTKAYIDYMRPRCVQLARVLKKTGSFYYHCDWHASHYVKVMLDQIFGENNFLNEIVWKRSAAHSDTKQGRKAFGNVSDSIFVYSGGDDEGRVWNTKYLPYDESYVKEFYNHVDEKTGRRYRLDNLTAAKGGGDTSYDFHGTKPYKGRYWAYSRENMEKFLAEDRLYFPKSGGTPAYKRYLDEMPGVSLQNVWDDIPPIGSNAAERLGYLQLLPCN